MIEIYRNLRSPIMSPEVIIKSVVNLHELCLNLHDRPETFREIYTKKISYFIKIIYSNVELKTMEFRFYDVSNDIWLIKIRQTEN